MLKKHPENIQQELSEIIQTLRNSQVLQDIPKLKKMAGSTNSYRIRVADYRIGCYLEENTIVLSRLLHRRDIYRFFPKWDVFKILHVKPQRKTSLILAA